MSGGPASCVRRLRENARAGQANSARLVVPTYVECHMRCHTTDAIWKQQGMVCSLVVVIHQGAAAFPRGRGGVAVRY